MKNIMTIETDTPEGGIIFLGITQWATYTGGYKINGGIFQI